MRYTASRGERGETLIELLVTVSIVGVAVVALVGGIGVSVMMSYIHREQAAAGAYVRAYAEAIESTVAASPSGYVSCAGTATYRSVYAPPDTNYTANVSAVTYWTGSSFSSTCTTDRGVQMLSLIVASGDGRASESLNIVIRKPCRSSDAACS
jgi:type II secretory pathway pseudopilin PulG